MVCYKRSGGLDSGPPEPFTLSADYGKNLDDPPSKPPITETKNRTITKEYNFRYSNGCAGDTAKAEQRSNKGDDQQAGSHILPQNIAPA
jgi:hypothetical protein